MIHSNKVEYVSADPEQAFQGDESFDKQRSIALLRPLLRKINQKGIIVSLAFNGNLKFLFP